MQEYAAKGGALRLRHRGRYDLVVSDTPPFAQPLDSRGATRMRYSSTAACSACSPRSQRRPHPARGDPSWWEGARVTFAREHASSPSSSDLLRVFERLNGNAASSGALRTRPRSPFCCHLAGRRAISRRFFFRKRMSDMSYHSRFRAEPKPGAPGRPRPAGPAALRRRRVASSVERLHKLDRLAARRDGRSGAGRARSQILRATPGRRRSGRYPYLPTGAHDSASLVAIADALAAPGASPGRRVGPARVAVLGSKVRRRSRAPLFLAVRHGGWSSPRVWRPGRAPLSPAGERVL